MNILELSEQEIVRRESLRQLRELGIDPYPAAAYPTDAFSTEIKASFVDLPTTINEEGEEVPTKATAENSRKVCIAGRIMSKRIMGKASFAELLDSKGRIQVYITRDDISASAEDTSMYNTVWKKCLDLGDFIGVNQRALQGTDGVGQAPQASAYREGKSRPDVRQLRGP